MRRRFHFVRLALCGVAGMFVGGASSCVQVEADHDDGCSDVVCGANATCHRGECLCDPAHEGDPDDACDPIQTIVIQDACNDGLDTEFVIHAENLQWKWPAGSDVFVTQGLGVDTVVDIVCLEGEVLCYGAGAGDLAWGIGLDGEDACLEASCCFECFADTYDIGRLVCN